MFTYDIIKSVGDRVILNIKKKTKTNRNYSKGAKVIQNFIKWQQILREHNDIVFINFKRPAVLNTTDLR